MKIKDKTKKARKKKLKKHVLVSDKPKLCSAEEWTKVVTSPRECMKRGSTISE